METAPLGSDAAPAPSSPAPAPALRAVFAALLVVFLVVLLRHAWVGDDAYITFRTVRNFIEGKGLTWNVGHRVQVYTHPLWMFLMSGVYLVTREVHFSSMALSIALSVAAVGLLLGRLRSGVAGAVFAWAAVVSSKAFMDYSTSGLENPLTHLLLAVFAALFLRGEADGAAPSDDARARGFLWLCLCACAMALNRLDTVLLPLPGLAYAGWRLRRWRPIVRGLLIGFAPLAAWELFSIVYYGFPFPNTAYAKLGVAVPRGRMMRQGLAYLVETLDLDPVTPLVLALGIAAPFALRAGRLVPLAAGAFLYVVYVVRIGGDFMMGRFLSAPFFLAAIVAARVIGAALDRQPLGVVPAVAALAVGLFATPRPTLKSDGSYVRPHPHYGERGIDDERAYYYPYTGLLRWAPGRNMLDEEEIAKYGRRVPPGGVAVLVAVGMSAWTAPRDAIIVDQLGITDPLTARLPFVGDWRPGHFNRGVPAGYVESLKQKKNVIADPAIAKLYDRIMKVVTGPLFTKERWGTMWGFWTERRR